MRLPAIPSLRYSCSGSRLAFSKGKTARESIIFETRWARRTPDCDGGFRDAESEVDCEGFESEFAVESGLFCAIRQPESVPRSSSCRSFRSSAAC